MEFVCLFVVRSFFIMLQLQSQFFLLLNLRRHTAFELKFLHCQPLTSKLSLAKDGVLSFRKQTILTLNSDALFLFLDFFFL